MKIEILKSKGQFYWRIRARNGRILCHSEKYKSWQGAMNTARRVRKAQLPIIDRTGNAK